MLPLPSKHPAGDTEAAMRMRHVMRATSSAYREASKQSQAGLRAAGMVWYAAAGTTSSAISLDGRAKQRVTGRVSSIRRTLGRMRTLRTYVHTRNTVPYVAYLPLTCPMSISSRAIMGCLALADTAVRHRDIVFHFVDGTRDLDIDGIGRVRVQ
ncbi:hypothetical protein BDW22DRAFT_1350387 [Trametopsis cervina]|nr:hypothetical protein BDW22DRAFT_1350387 [Trametopsis cervina]